VDTLLGVHGERPWVDRMYVEPAAVEPAVAEPPQQREPEPAPPAHSLDAYVGRFRHEGYGDLLVRVVDGQLAVQVGEFDLDAKHRSFETWDLRYVALAASATLSFFTGADGAVTEAVLQFEHVAAPIRYVRVPEEVAV
jgi:hypothetical protein